MTRIHCKLLMIAALLSAGAIAAAQEAPADRPYLKPCKADVAKFCKGVDPANDGIIGCLKEHREEVSDSCKARLAQLRVKPKPAPKSPAAAPAAK
jgi:hypothetical protein